MHKALLEVKWGISFYRGFPYLLLFFQGPLLTFFFRNSTVVSSDHNNLTWKNDNMGKTLKSDCCCRQVIVYWLTLERNIAGKGTSFSPWISLWLCMLLLSSRPEGKSQWINTYQFILWHTLFICFNRYGMVFPDTHTVIYKLLSFLNNTYW